ncbi:tRNA A64-2'-O-ribosylphosphate transferase [Phlyctochytrium arcticum]|nr:tRNA A64-2'-O-ribosylphosphate transferase [Phlyctochytrium arcticum]
MTAFPKDCNPRESIRKESRNLYNRLHSIHSDAQFVQEVSNWSGGLPVVANERCGSWYIPPSLKWKKSVYFKSTDGHFGRWDCNLRRLNLHIVKDIAAHRGCMMVDSTRNGKRIPDAFSKTVPIWCAVLNTAVWTWRGRARNTDTGVADDDGATPEDEERWTKLYTLPSVVSPSEHAQITSLIPTLAQRLLNSPSVDFPALSCQLTCPLRPLWITPSSSLQSSLDMPGVFPVVLVSASRAVPDGVEYQAGWTYVQGSGDDEEMWSGGLTPEVFWQHCKELLATGSGAACEEKVQELVTQEQQSSCPASASVESYLLPSRAGQPYTWLGTLPIAIGNRVSGRPPQCWQTFDLVINCGAPEWPELPSSGLESESISLPPQKRYVFLPIPEGKKGQHALYKLLPSVLETVLPAIQQGHRILIHCMQGKDRSVGITLAILTRYLTAGTCPPAILDAKLPMRAVTKEVILDRLLLIQSHRHVASPTRATMQKVKEFFMSPGWYLDRQENPLPC